MEPQPEKENEKGNKQHEDEPQKNQQQYGQGGQQHHHQQHQYQHREGQQGQAQDQQQEQEQARGQQEQRRFVNIATKPMDPLDLLWLKYRTYEFQHRNAAPTEEQRARQALRSRQSYARRKGELRWEDAPIFQRRHSSPSAASSSTCSQFKMASDSTPASTSTVTSTPLTNLSTTAPQPRPTVPVQQPVMLPLAPLPVLPVMMNPGTLSGTTTSTTTIPIPAATGLAPVPPLVMSPVAISQLYNYNHQPQQYPVMSAFGVAPPAPPVQTNAVPQPKQRFVPLAPASTRPSGRMPVFTPMTQSSFVASAVKPEPHSDPGSDMDDIPIPFAQGLLPLEGNEDSYTDLLISLFSKDHVPLESCSAVIRLVNRYMFGEETPDFDARALIARSEEGRELLRRHDEEQEAIGVMRRHGSPVRGRLTNAAMLEFLRKQRRRNQAVRIGKQSRAELIANIRALEQSSSTDSASYAELTHLAPRVKIEKE